MVLTRRAWSSPVSWGSNTRHQPWLHVIIRVCIWPALWSAEYCNMRQIYTHKNRSGNLEPWIYGVLGQFAHYELRAPAGVNFKLVCLVARTFKIMCIPWRLTFGHEEIYYPPGSGTSSLSCHELSRLGFFLRLVSKRLVSITIYEN